MQIMSLKFSKRSRLKIQTQVIFKTTVLDEITKQVYIERKNCRQHRGDTLKFRDLEDEEKQSKGNKRDPGGSRRSKRARVLNRNQERWSITSQL